MTAETRPFPPRPAPATLLLALLALLVPLTLTGCGPSETDIQQARQEVEETLRAYLPLMADAYRTGNVEPLKPYATQKEIAILEKSIHDLRQRGRVMDNKLLELTLEDFNMPQWANVYVTTVEYWDVTAYAAGSEHVLGRDERQFSRVRYQLKRTGDHWMVLARNRDPSINP
jgi:hypothetical protein